MGTKLEAENVERKNRSFLFYTLSFQKEKFTKRNKYK